jgi:hypothetical protein
MLWETVVNGLKFQCFELLIIVGAHCLKLHSQAYQHFPNQEAIGHTVGGV